MRFLPGPARCARIAALACFAFAAAASAKPQFIEQSRIIYPKKAGELTLAGAQFDEANIDAGVALTYELASKPGVRIDVFIYPAGRMAAADAVQSGTAGLRASVEQAAQAGYYDTMHMKGEKVFDLKANENTTLRGRMLSFDFTQDAVRYESRALLFYRYDYYIKVRTSTDAFDAAALDKVLVQVAADLIPGIRVRNRGDCKPDGDIGDQILDAQANNPDETRRNSSSVFLTDRVPKDELIDMLNAELVRQEESGCVPNFGDRTAKVGKGEEFKVIEFPKGAWD